MTNIQTPKMDSKCLDPNYTACYGDFRDLTKFTCVCVCVFLGQIFIEKINFGKTLGGIEVIGGVVGFGVIA